MSETTAEYKTKKVPSIDRTELSRKHLARMGVCYIEEAILDVLFEEMEARPEDPYVQRTVIRQKIGVHVYDPLLPKTYPKWSIQSFLFKLKGEKRIEQEKRGRDSFWKLTEAEYQKRG